MIKVMRGTVLSLLLVSVNSFASINECEFYKIKSEELGCSSSSYLINFGYKYCRLFFYPSAHISKQAINVFEHIRPCLIRELKNYSALTCENVRPVAFDSHISCYAMNGFCELSNKDLGIIYNSALSTGLNSFAVHLAARMNEVCEF